MPINQPLNKTTLKWVVKKLLKNQITRIKMYFNGHYKQMTINSPLEKEKWKETNLI